MIYRGSDKEVTANFAEIVAPAVTTDSATGIGTTTSTLNGTLTNLGSASSIEVSFEWGETTAHGRETAARIMTATGSFTASLSGLSPNTTYHFRAKAVGDGTSYGADRSFTTARAAGGGGGGGGGGGPPAPPAGTTDVRGMVSTTGRFFTQTTAISEDRQCRLTIPGGTVGLTEELEPLTKITMLIMAKPPPPPEGAHIIGLAYDFQPSGATFDPPITLTFKYDPDDIPEGIAEEDLVLAYYDEAAGKWIELEGCVVDPETNTITAPLSHFTAFGAMFIPAPAAFSLSGLEVSPAEAEIGSTITISTLVENSGDLAGSYALMLRIDGVAEEIKKITLGAGASEKVTFTVSRDVAGSYSVDVNGLSGSFTLKEKPAPPTAPPPEEAPPPAKPFPWPLIGGIIGGVIVVGLLIFFWIRRREVRAWLGRYRTNG